MLIGGKNENPGGWTPTSGKWSRCASPPSSTAETLGCYLQTKKILFVCVLSFLSLFFFFFFLVNFFIH